MRLHAGDAAARTAKAARAGWRSTSPPTPTSAAARHRPTRKNGPTGSDRPGAAHPARSWSASSRDNDRGVTFYRARMADATELPRVDLAKVCRGLGITGRRRCVFLLADGAEFLISVFDNPPLSQIFPATRELLTPDAKGMYVCGFTITGQPVKNMVWQHDKNAAAHGLILGVSRSGKTQYFAIGMAAESLRRPGVWLSTVPQGREDLRAGAATSTGRAPTRCSWSASCARRRRCARSAAEMPWPYDGQPHDYKPGDPAAPTGS